MNRAFLKGRLCKDPISSTAGQTRIAAFNIAVNRTQKDSSGNYIADFIQCKAFNERADFVMKYFKKGQEILLEGQISTGSYQAQDGTTKYTTEVIVNNCEFCGSKQEEQKKAEQPYQAPVIDDGLPY